MIEVDISHRKFFKLLLLIIDYCFNPLLKIGAWVSLIDSTTTESVKATFLFTINCVTIQGYGKFMRKVWCGIYLSIWLLRSNLNMVSSRIYFRVPLFAFISRNNEIINNENQENVGAV